jgi:hypothetical protein
MQQFFYFFKIVIGVLAILWLTVRIIMLIFGNYQKGNVLSNEAVFDIYLNTDSLDIDAYFGIPEGTFNRDEHVILCNLPVNTSSIKSNYLDVKLGIDSINCNEKYTANSYVKYYNTELNKNESRLLIVKKYIGQIEKKKRQTLRQISSERFYRESIIAEKEIDLKYEKKKINRLVISYNGVYEYCR